MVIIGFFWEEGKITRHKYWGYLGKYSMVCLQGDSDTEQIDANTEALTEKTGKPFSRKMKTTIILL